MCDENSTLLDTIAVGSRVNFSSFANLLEKISKIDDASNRAQGKIEEKKRLVLKFIELWRNEAKQLKEEFPKHKIDENFYPIMRLLLPSDDRRVYGLKENKLANYLIDVLCISKTSMDGKKLLNYRAPQNTKSEGDFGSVAYFVLKTRCKEDVTLKIDDVNKHLNNISLNNSKGKEGQKEVHKSIMHLLMNLSALQLKWLIRIILKELKIGIKENAIFDVYHPDASDLYNCTSSLEKVCESLTDPNKRLHEIAVSLFSPCRPMLGEKAKPNQIEQLIGGGEFYIETKYDGERFQLHKMNNKYCYFSRNGHDYTDAFGATNSSGSLTQFIHDCFDTSVKSIILDGEMCAYNSNDKVLLSKSDTYDVKSLTSNNFSNSEIQICFCVFDCLLYNDEILTNKPLKERIEYLNKSIKECEGRIILSPREISNSNQQVIDALNKAIDCRLEGIVVKNPTSVYKPSIRTGSAWYKVKPDYMLGLNDDLDLLIVGGYYGTGRRSGLLSHFLLAVAKIDKKPQSNEEGEIEIQEPTLFYSFCKIGSGYSMKELSDFNRKLTNKWTVYDKKDPPKHLAVTYEKPDVWIEPKDSFVVQVKAVEIVQSDKYKTGVTLRFPRLEKFRDDKPWYDCMTLTELNELKEKNQGKLASKHFDLNDLEEGHEDYEPEVKKKKSGGKKPKQPIISARYRGVDASSVEKIDDFLKNKEFCIIMGDDKYDKLILEKYVIENGGNIVQNPGENTYCVITSKIIHKVNSYIKKDLYNIVKTDWLIKCIQNKTYYPWTPSDMLHYTEKTRQYFSQLFDQYGDDYSEDICIDKLKLIFTNMTEKSEYNDDIHLKIAFIENKYFPDESFEYGLFRLCNIYLDLFKTLDDSSENNLIINSSLDFTKLKILWYGGIISKQIDTLTTHCVLDKNDLLRLDKIKSINRLRDKKLHIVSNDWVEECIKKQRIIDELPYHL